MKAILDKKESVWIEKIGKPYSLIQHNGVRKSVRSTRLILIEDKEPRVDGIVIILGIVFLIVIFLLIYGGIKLLGVI